MSIIYFLCIDIGTSSMKTAFFLLEHNNKHKDILHNEPKLLQEERVPFIAKDISVIQEWKDAFVEICNNMKAHIDSSSTHPTYIVFSGHGPSSIFLDSKHNILHYIPWYSEQYIPIPNEASYYIPQILYTKQNMPEIYEHTSCIMSPAEYMTFLLCQKPYTFIPPNPKLIPNIWTRQSLKFHNIKQEKLAPQIVSGTPIGYPNSPLIKSLNISHTIIVAGGLDYQSASLGGAYTNDFYVFQRSGSSVILNIYIKNTTNTQTNKQTNPSQFDILKKAHKTFILPAFLEKYLNFGLVVPLYDEIYKRASTYINIPNTNPKTLLHALSMLSTDILVFIDDVKTKILDNKLPFEKVCSEIEQTYPTEKYGYIYITLLLTILKSVYNTLLEINAISSNNSLHVSGGHAADDTLMQMQADYLSCKIQISNPIHTELYGNIGLALHAHLQKTQKLTNNTIDFNYEDFSKFHTYAKTFLPNASNK